MKKKATKSTQTNIQQIVQYCVSHYFIISTPCILFFAAILRFFDYSHRWTLAADQAGFALVARYAIQTFQIPLLGPFSSAGPFQTGGEWYWLVMIGQLFNVHAVITPWIFMTVLSVLFVWLMIVLGEKLVSKKFGLLVGFFTAISTGQIIQSTNLTNQTPLMIFSAIALFLSLLYSRSKRIRYLFLLGFVVSFAATIHLQGVAVAPIILFTLLFNQTVNIKHYAALLLGGLFPWVPVLYVDIHNNFFTIQNMINYYLFNQHPVSYEELGRRWLTFLILFTPSAWAYTIGGHIVVGYVLIILAGITFLYRIFIKNVSKEWVIIFLSTAVMITLLRYTRTPIFESYFVFMHPLLLLISAWTVYVILQKSKVIGIVLIVTIAFFSLNRSMIEIQKQANTYVQDVSRVRNVLVNRYPTEKFAIYEYKYRTAAFSQPLSLLLDEIGLVDDHGRRIGIARRYNKNDPDSTTLPSLPIPTEYAIIDLNGSSSAQLERDGWVFVNPSAVYNSVQNWYQN